MDRKGFIGGSDTHHIFNLLPYGCARRLWYEKRGIEPDYLPQENYHMKRGKFFEPIVAKLYEKQTGKKTRRVKQIVCKEFPFIVGHLDRAILAEPNQNNSPLEIKCPSLRNFAKIKREGVPEGYVLQVHHYLGLLNADYGSYAIFSAETTELLTFDVPRNQKLIDTILQAEIEFWEKVQKAIEPDRLPIADKRCQTCHWRITCQGITLELPIGEAVARPDLENLVQDYAQARTILNEAEEYFEETKNGLKAKLGDTQVADVAGTTIYYKQIESERWNLKRLETERPELTKDYKQKTISRPLRVYF